MGNKGGGIDDLDELADVQLELGEEQAEIARNWLDFSQQQYADNQEFVGEILEVQLPAMREQLAAGREDRERYEKFFAPMEERLAREAEGYDTTARREAEAGRAGADVAAAGVAARENAARALESFGIDPSTTRAAAIDRQAALQTALSTAAAENQARTRVEDTGRALRTSAVNVGRGFPGEARAGYGAAVGTGGAAVGTQMAPQAQLNQAQSVGQNWFGGATQAIQGAASTREAVSGFNAQTPWLDATAGIAGMAVGGMIARGSEEGGPVRETVMKGTPPGPTDTVPLMVNPDEFVIPAEVVRRKGTDFFDRLIEKAREGAS